MTRSSSPRRSITYRRKPLLCKLFGHFSLAERSEAPKRCSESQSGSEIRFYMIFMLCIILRSLMAELCLSIFHIHNASMTMRLSEFLYQPYPNTSLSARLRMICGISQLNSIFDQNPPQISWPSCRLSSATVYYLTKSILSSASYVWRRGKPSTWLPRQKLAEERIYVCGRMLHRDFLIEA